VGGRLLNGTVDEVFVGREVELARAAVVLDRVPTGQPWLITVEGESGIGKSALARQLVASATGFRVLSARADPAETDLDYGPRPGVVAVCHRGAASRGRRRPAGQEPGRIGYRRCAMGGPEIGRSPYVHVSALVGRPGPRSGRPPVSGQSWMDHQWGAFNFASGAGWDWFSIQLSNGQQYMLYFVRD
jgi:hypothetical protein